MNDCRIRQILRAGRLPEAFKFADTWLIPRKAIEGYTRKKPDAPKRFMDSKVLAEKIRELAH